MKDSLSLSANLRSEKNEEDFLPNQKSTYLYDLGDVKIGVIGLTTMETKTSSSAFLDNSFPNYKFLPYTDIVINKSK